MALDIAAFSDIYAADDKRIQNLRVDVDLTSPDVRAAFARAARGEDVADKTLVDHLTGKDTVVFNSSGLDPRKQPDYNQWTDTIAYNELFIRRGELPLSDMQERLQEAADSLTASYEALSKETGLSVDLLRGIGESMQYKDNQNLTGNHVESFSKILNQTIKERLHTGDAHVTAASGQSWIFLTRLTDERYLKEGFLGFDTNDRPPNPTRVPREISEFITAIHESEHAMDQDKQLIIYNPDYEEFKQISHEIDGDLPILQFMRDNNLQYVADEWLRNRQVDSFKTGLYHSYDHDTATFLRVYQETGQQIDLKTFFDEKKKLMEMISGDLGLIDNLEERRIILEQLMKDDKYPKFSLIMGAAESVGRDDLQQRALKEHGQPFDESKILSDIQRAELNSFLDDARALGYKTDPDYKKVMADLVDQAIKASQKADPALSPAAPAPQP